MARGSSYPTYRLHKASGQAVVSIPLGGGKYKDFYLGPFGTRETSPASWSEYDRKIAEWLASGRTVPTNPTPDLTVTEMLNAYRRYAETYYRKAHPITGQMAPTQQQPRIRDALKPVSALYGDTPAGKFGPLALKACREVLIQKGMARTHVNQLVGCIRRAFAWGVSEELIPSSVVEGLRTVRGLLAGRTDAKETARIIPVEEDAIAVVRERVLPQVAALIDFQLLTACRPGEAVLLRPCDLDRSKEVWVYRPVSHKTMHHGHERTIFVGPRCQALLAPYLLRSADDFCFSAVEAARTRLKKEGQAVRLRLRKTPGDCYTVDTYRSAVYRACDKARVERWHPAALRHNAATRIVAEFGWETARILLGHRNVGITRVYAEDDYKKVTEAMAKTG